MKLRRYALLACVLSAAVSTAAVGFSEARGRSDRFVSQCSGKPLAVERRPNIAFGDSITWGVNGKTCRPFSLPQPLPVTVHSPLTDESNYPADLSALIGETVLNYGVPGETTAQGLSRLRSVLATVHPGTVLILEGVNDLFGSASVAKVTRNLRQMIRASRQSGAQPILLTSLPTFYPKSTAFRMVNGRVAKLAASERVLARAEDVRLIDTASVMNAGLTARPDGSSDYVHPNAAGYQRIADLVAAEYQSHAFTRF